MSDDSVSYYSDRGNRLAYTGTPGDSPVLTCELYIKWYALYLVEPDKTVRQVPLELRELEQYAEGESVVGDHCWNPYVIQRLADAKDWIIDDLSFDLLVGRWHTNRDEAVTVFQRLNAYEAVERACQEPTLLDALAWIAVWDTERVVVQARSDYRSPEGQQWETCFKILFQDVLEKYPDRREDYRTEDWTLKDNRSNSSDEFLALCNEVERLIRDSAFHLISGQADMVAGLIMAQLAHVHGLVPRKTKAAHGQELQSD